MGVVNLPGCPTMQLTGGALARLEAMTPPDHGERSTWKYHRRLAAGAGLCHNFGGPSLGNPEARRGWYADPLQN